MSTDTLIKKWGPILEHASAPEITDRHKKKLLWLLNFLKTKKSLYANHNLVVIINKQIC